MRRSVFVLVWLALGDAFVTPPVGVVPHHRVGGGGAPPFLRRRTRGEKGKLSAAPTPDQVLLQLGFKLGETVIVWGVPLLGLLLFADVFFKDAEEALQPRTKLELEFGLDEQKDRRSKLDRALGLPAPPTSSNRRKAPSYLKVERLNSRLESFDYDLTKASEGAYVAARRRRRKRLEEALGDWAKLELSEANFADLEREEKKFKERIEAARTKAANARGSARALAFDPKIGSRVIDGLPLKEDVAAEPKKGKILEKVAEKMAAFDDGYGDFKVSSKDSSKDSTKKKKSKGMEPEAAVKALKKTQGKPHWQALQEAAGEVMDAEAEFLKWVSTFAGNSTDLRDRITKLVFASAGSLEANEDIVQGFLNATASTPTHKKPQKVYVLRYFGDVEASQTFELRQEVTALLEFAEPGDEVVLRLSTGGGTVTGYGAAAGQLLRLKDAGIRLTICVEEVAASGGYMMACAADHLVASPFAVLGSIGVIADIPNVYDRLKREGVEFQTVTAGKYKRTLTPTKKPTREDFVKTQAGVQEVLDLFKSFVKDQRPSLDIDDVATGETWYGQAAIDKGLCDEIITFDDLVLRKLKAGADVYGLRYVQPRNQNLLQTFLDGDTQNLGLVDRFVAKLAGALVGAITKGGQRLLPGGLPGGRTTRLSFDDAPYVARRRDDDDDDVFGSPPPSSRPLGPQRQDSTPPPLYMIDPDSTTLF